jgi:hypothetical protein
MQGLCGCELNGGLLCPHSFSCVPDKTREAMAGTQAGRDARTWMPRRVSAAMATQFLPVIAHMDAPLYSVMDCAVRWCGV